MSFQILSDHVIEMRAMVQRAGGLLAHEDVQTNGGTSVAPTSYPRDIIMPCDRHDNDKADMTKIKIYPTRGELLSDAREFLPSTDREQPHFLTDQVARHFDTQFRLLRHDTFGQLKQAISNLMASLQNDTAGFHNPQHALGDMRASCYSHAHISYVSFGRQGLEVHITFLQPHAIRNKGAIEARRWWDESRRLEEGTLLSFISGTGADMQHIFFTVSARSTDHLPKDLNTYGNDPKQKTIIAKLATNDQTVMESMMLSSCHQVKGILVEFPGVLPATFVAILENLQSMQRLNRLPFRQWILPDRTADGNATTLTIPPPLYARKPGFTFPLESIIMEGASSFALDPSASVQDDTILDQVDSRTTLDRGQCRALIEALTREYCLIQGPPGRLSLSRTFLHLCF